MNKSYLVGSVFTLLMGATNLASAIPVPVGPALTGIGNGLNARWVDVVTASTPHNVTQANAATNLNAGDTGFVKDVKQVVTSINFADNEFNQNGNGGAISAIHSAVPLDPDDSFAVKYSGFINIKSEDTYSFNAYTDDGFTLSIGGEQIFEHFGDRSPGASNIDVTLGAGLYAIEFVGWEQGGQFVNELSWRTPSSSSFSVINSDVLFRSAVPVPAAFMLFGSGLLGLVGIRIKAKANSIC